MLALIAGNGALPVHAAKALPDPPLVAAVEGTAPELPHDLTASLNHLASLIEALRARGVTELCFAGGMRRLGFDPAKVEPASQPYIDRIVAAHRKGDDGALRIILSIFEEAGFAIRAVQDIAPDLLPPKGSATGKAPSRDTAEEAAVADRILAAMGAADIGQACVLNHGQPIAIESAFGTDWMLDSLRHRPDGQGGILFKSPKPGQDRRVDLPTIGPSTVQGAAKAGLEGIVIEAGGVLVLDYKACVKAADDAGMFLWVRPI